MSSSDLILCSTPEYIQVELESIVETHFVETLLPYRGGCGSTPTSQVLLRLKQDKGIDRSLSTDTRHPTPVSLTDVRQSDQRTRLVPTGSDV